MKQIIIDYFQDFYDIQKHDYGFELVSQYLTKKLEEKGFTRFQINSTLDWLTKLFSQKKRDFSLLDTEQNLSFRIFSERELSVLSDDHIKLILLLRNAGFIDISLGEIIIEWLLDPENREFEINELAMILIMQVFDELDEELDESFESQLEPSNFLAPTSWYFN